MLAAVLLTMALFEWGVTDDIIWSELIPLVLPLSMILIIFFVRRQDGV